MTGQTVYERASVANRWTFALARNGWTAISNDFLKYYHLLKPAIGHPEVLLLIHIISFKWDERAPFPSVTLLARQMGVTQTAVRNNLRKLEKKGLIRREQRKGKTNEIDCAGLFAAIEKLAAEKAKAKRTHCAGCGIKRLAGANFCSSCGRNFTSDDEQSLEMLMPGPSQEISF